VGTVTVGVLLLNMGAFGAIASALAFGEFSAPVFLFVVLAVIGGYIAWKGSQKTDKSGQGKR
jgi:membrane protein implicated in regulation of membrane protease activity